MELYLGEPFEYNFLGFALPFRIPNTSGPLAPTAVLRRNLLDLGS
jgi:hypothetical protein